MGLNWHGVNAVTDKMLSLALADGLPLLLFIGVSLTLVVFFVYVCFYNEGSNPWVTKLNTSFYQEIERETGIALLSPFLVTVYARAHDNVDDYSERLIVVSPHNWMIYTNNGIQFHFISNNIDLSRSRCNTARSLNAIEYRLLSVDEQSDELTRYDNSGKLRLSCVNYTYDQLMRIFGRSADKTVYHLAHYFDKKKNNAAPDLTVDEILDLLIVNAVV